MVDRMIVKSGVGLEKPNKGSRCKVKLKILLEDGTLLQESEEDIVIGEGESELSESLDKCLECMHSEEVCIIQNIPHDDDKLLVHAQKSLQCELELLSFTKAKEPWQSTSSDKIDLAIHHKAKGTACFKADKWLPAARHYSRALKQLILVTGQPHEDRNDEYNQLRFSCLLNLAACQGKLRQYEFVTKTCTKALAMEPENIKALFRRGQAFLVLNEFENAREDLEKALNLDQDNSAVQEQLGILRKKERMHDIKLSKALGAMFGR